MGLDSLSVFYFSLQVTVWLFGIKELLCFLNLFWYWADLLPKFSVIIFCLYIKLMEVIFFGLFDLFIFFCSFIFFLEFYLPSLAHIFIYCLRFLFSKLKLSMFCYMIFANIQTKKIKSWKFNIIQISFQQAIILIISTCSLKIF